MHLDQYLRASKESIDAFAIRAHIPSGTAHRVAGRLCRPRADIALAIIKASEGAVTLEDLARKPRARKMG